MFDGLRDGVRRWRFGEPVIVVSGLPRSGTSMMMAMLQAGGVEPFTDGARDADVDNPKGYFEHERVKHLEGDKDKSWMRGSRGRAVKVISFLLKDLPEDNDYRVIFMRRDLDEILASQHKMLTRLGTGAVDPAEAERTKEAYRNDIVRARLFCKKRGFGLLEVQYRDTVERAAETARHVNAFLGGKLNEAAMAAAVDRELYRNRAS